MSDDHDAAVKPEHDDDLEKRLREVQDQLDQLRANTWLIWEILVRIGNKLQRSSTSIKTAVSSLLDFDIFWDETTQYEFLQVIDSSNDELADLIVLMTLAFRSQAKALEIETEPNVIQEILATVQKNLAKNDRSVQLVTNDPPIGKPALVDYQYMSVALSLLIEVIISEVKNTTEVVLQATEDTASWHLQINDIGISIATIIRQFFEKSDEIAKVVNQIRPENALKLMTACRILYLQNIRLCVNGAAEDPTTLCLTIPTAANYALME